MQHGSRHPLRVGMFATSNGQRGRVVATDFIAARQGSRSIMAPTVDLSTPDGLLVGIAVRHLD